MIENYISNFLIWDFNPVFIYLLGNKFLCNKSIPDLITKLICVFVGNVLAGLLLDIFFFLLLCFEKFLIADLVAVN